MDIQDKITDASPRQVRRVRPFGTGDSGHVTIPQSLASVGDRVLVIRLEGEGVEG